MIKKQRIVTIGGGTGSFTLLSGLKRYHVDLSAIVSMADDGGSAGVLRDELGVLPPGDVRQCLVALSQSSDKMRELMNYRFQEGVLKGHNFGNLFVSALEKTCGSMSQGLEEASDILKVSGKVIPVSEEDMRLVIELENGTILYGEDQLDVNDELRKQGVALKNISLQKNVRAYSGAIQAIAEADVIVLGPGDQFGSIIPNLLVREIAAAIQQAKAHVVYVASLTNKKGLTQHWTVKEYVHSLEQYIGKGRIHSVIWNSRPIPKTLVEKYEQQEGEDALVKIGDISNKTYRIFKADVASVDEIVMHAGDMITSTRSFIRHDSHDLAKAIMFAVTMDENNSIIQDIV